jgi:DNA-binding NtrC family response regulator
MPGMNGLEAFKKLRKVSPKSKVIMITGYGKTLKDLVEEARELGVHSIIDKPFKINQITDAIQEIIPHAD